jgi:hypothetical protein
VTQEDEAINKQILSHYKYLAWGFGDFDTSLDMQVRLISQVDESAPFE